MLLTESPWEVRCRAARALGERTDAIVRTGDGTIVESLTEVMVGQPDQTLNHTCWVCWM